MPAHKDNTPIKSAANNQHYQCLDETQGAYDRAAVSDDLRWESIENLHPLNKISGVANQTK